MPKGLDDLLLAGGRPRRRGCHRTQPVGFTQRRRPRPAPVDAVEPGMSPRQGRELVAERIEQFVRTASPGEAQLIQASPGLGKSYALGRALRAFARTALVLFGTKKVAYEWAAQFGFTVLEGRNRRNCERMDVVEALTDGGYDVERYACGTAGEPHCPFRGNCVYYQQFDPGGTIVAVTEQLWNRHALTGRDLIVLDDADLMRALVARGRASTEQLGQALRYLSGPRYVTVSKLVFALLLASASHASDRRPLLGARAWDAISQAASTLGFDLLGALKQLEDEERFYDRDRQPRKSPRWPAPRRKGGEPLQAQDVGRLPSKVIRTIIDVLLEEARAFGRGSDLNSYLRIARDGIDVQRLKPALSSDSGTPEVTNAAMLVLDATPIAPLTNWVLQDHRARPPVDCGVDLPALVDVVQYATAANSRQDIMSGRRSYVTEIDEERRREPLEPGQEGLAGYKLLSPGALGFPDDRFASYGAARGGNQLSDVLRLFAVGRPMQPTDELVYLAQVIHHDGPVVSGELILAPRRYVGQPWEIDVLDFADPRAAELMLATRDHELLQAIHRARPNTLGLDGDGRPALRLALHTSHPVVGLRIDKLHLPRDNGPDGNTSRSAEAYARIAAAITSLEAEGKEPSIREIAMAAKASRNTVSDYIASHGATNNPPGGRRSGGARRHGARSSRCD